MLQVQQSHFGKVMLRHILNPLYPCNVSVHCPSLPTLFQLTSFAVVAGDLAQLELCQLELHPQWAAVYTQLAPPSPPPSPQHPAVSVHSALSSPQQLPTVASNPDDPTDGVHSTLVAVPARRSSRVSVHSAHPVYLSDEDVVHAASRPRRTARLQCSIVELSSDSSDSEQLSKKKKRSASLSKTRATSGLHDFPCPSFCDTFPVHTLCAILSVLFSSSLYTDTKTCHRRPVPSTCRCSL